jgi:hypothetical protein
MNIKTSQAHRQLLVILASEDNGAGSYNESGLPQELLHLQIAGLAPALQAQA